MTARQSKPADELKMSGAEFDRIMGLALRVKPETARPKKAKAKRAKRKAAK